MKINQSYKIQTNKTIKFAILALLVCSLITNSDTDNNYILPSTADVNSAFNPFPLLSFGEPGTGNGQFSGIFDLASNATHIAVADTSTNNRIQIFDLEGNYLNQFGSSGNGLGELNTPSGIAFNDTNIFVVENSNNRVQIFDLSGNSVTTFGEFGSGIGQFNNPFGIALNQTHIFVTEYYNHRIQVFDLVGNSVDSFGEYGSADGQLIKPFGIAVNGTNVFVADSDNNRITIYDLAGNYIAKIASLGTIRGVDVDDKYIYITLISEHKILVYDHSLRFITSFGENGSNLGQLYLPFGIISTNTNIIVGEFGNKRVQVFSKGNVAPKLHLLSNFENISIAWTEPIDSDYYPVIKYRIYRGLNRQLLYLLDETFNLFYTDFLNDNATYYYAITAISQTGESKYSNIVSAKVQEIETQYKTLNSTFTQQNTVTATDTTYVTTIHTSYLSFYDTITLSEEHASLTEQNTLQWQPVFFLILPILSYLLRIKMQDHTTKKGD